VTIEKGKVVLMHYTLKNEEGEVLDSSSGQEPLGFIHGTGMIIPGLEQVLLGKVVNDKFTTVIPPEDAYGAKNESFVETVSLSKFEDPKAVKVGAKFQLDNPDQIMAVVTHVEEDQVTLDMNHPLAGETLYFDIEIVDVREATAEEVDHGHVHGVGGHQH